MTLQQMEYVIAVDKYRHFVRAAEACFVTQSTLSSMLQKLEQELDVEIFDRTKHPVEPTPTGKRIIDQIKVVLFNTLQLKEMVQAERKQDEGLLTMGVIPTVAPYILPKMFKTLHNTYPKITLKVSEFQTSSIIQRLERAELDIALLATPLNNPQLLEIPMYYEKFVAYISPNEPLYHQQTLETHRLPMKHLWVLQEGHCLRTQVLNICDQKSEYSTIYEAGSIDTLVKIVDENDGYTLIPELHVNQLNNGQQHKIRRLVNPEPVREISLVVRHDFMRERLINIIANTIRSIIPDEMVDSRLKKFAIKL